MKTVPITVRVPAKLKRRITASARKQGKTPHRWAVEALTQAAGGDEPQDLWAEHWEWHRKHARPAPVDLVDAQRRRER